MDPDFQYNEEFRFQELLLSLPQEIQDKILAHLPLPGFFRLRHLCRRWYSLIYCPRFLKLSSQLPRSQPWVLLPKFPSYLGCLLYNPDSGKWHQFSLVYLPLNLHVDSSQAGLLVMKPRECSSLDLFVCNPLLKRYDQIPCPDFIKGTSVLVEKPNRNFQVVVLSEILVPDGAIVISRVYDSVNGYWRDGSSHLPLRVSLGRPVKNIVICGGRLYVVSQNLLTSSDALWTYSIQDDEWKELGLPHEGVGSSYWIVELYGCIFLVQLEFTESLQIWMLDQTSGRWMFTGHLAEEYLKELIGSQKSSLDACVGLGNLLILCRLPKILAFNMLEKSWTWLPHHPDFEEKSYFARTVLNFSPRLSTIV